MFNGSLDDLAIWSRNLSVSEISGLNNNPGILLNGIISAEGNQIKNLADPTDPNDAVNKQYVDEVAFDKDGISDASFFADLTVEEASLALEYANETDFISMVDNGNLTISDTLEELLNNADVLNFADKYTITTVGSPAQTYPGDVADVGELSVEQAAIYYGATNFVSPENINPGPNYIVKDTAQAIADGANSADIAVANALFAARDRSLGRRLQGIPPSNLTLTPGSGLKFSDGEQHEADRHHHHADDEEEGDVAWPVGHVAVGGRQQLVQHDEHHHAADHREHDAEDELGEHALQKRLD